MKRLFSSCKFKIFCKNIIRNPRMKRKACGAGGEIGKGSGFA